MGGLQFPSLGGVAGPQGLTGWSVTFLHTSRKTTPALRATPPKEGNFSAKGTARSADDFPFPSLGGVAGPQGLTGWSVTFLHTLEKDHPVGFADTPPKEGNLPLL